MSITRQADIPKRSIFDDQLFRARDVVRQSRIASDAAGTDSPTTDIPPDTVRCATTANRALSGLTAVDGVSIVAGDRVAVIAQSTASENGIYLAASGTWSRAVDTIYAGTTWEILQGTLYGNHQLVCTNDTDPTGTDNLAFEVRPGGGGTGNKVAKWSAAKTLADSLITDDGTRVQIGSSLTTGLVNIERNTISSATLYVGNTSSTGAGTALYVTTATATSNGHAAEFHNAGGGAGVSVTVTGSGNGIEVNSSAGVGVQSNPTGNGSAFSSSRNLSTATAPLVDFHEDHASATATVIEATNDGLGRTAYFARDNASATDPVVQIVQDNANGAQSTVTIRNDSTNASHFGLAVDTAGGIAGFFESDTNTSGYIYRNGGSATAPTAVVWQDNAGDSNDVLYVRGDGTGNLLALNAGGANVIEVSSAGRLNTKKARSFSHTTQASSFTAAVDVCVYLIDTGTAVANVTITLPDDASMPAGWTFYVKDIGNNAATRNIIIARGAGDTYTINNVAGSYTMNVNKRGAQFFWDGVNMHVLHVTTT